jgi:ring-1,2-phenylacetyl-CoA epoxidase subunit PaaC
MAQNDIKTALFDYCLRLGDTSLVLGHRLSEWCGHGPVLEQDIALINVALDLVGQSTNLLEYAAKVEEKGRTADDLAYLRESMNYRNALLVEQPNGDFGCTIVRQFFFDAFHYYQFEQLKNSKDETLAAIANKSIKEITYHLRHSKEWIVRLGDGTDESNRRVQDAVNELWTYTGDLFAMNQFDEVLIKEGIAFDLKQLKPAWEKMVKEVMSEAKLALPENNFMQSGSLEGKHTEHLGYLLAEMQSLPRAHPGATW